MLNLILDINQLINVFIILKIICSMMNQNIHLHKIDKYL